MCKFIFWDFIFFFSKNMLTYSVWVWNLVCHVKARAQIEGVSEHGNKNIIWAWEG
jgi:hypothetical protein